MNSINLTIPERMSILTGYTQERNPNSHLSSEQFAGAALGSHRTV